MPAKIVQEPFQKPFQEPLVLFTLIAALLFGASAKIGVFTSQRVAAVSSISTLSYLLGGVATYWMIERLPSLWIQ